MNYSELLTANTRSDDYVNATALCQKFGREFTNFRKLEATQKLVERAGHVYNLTKSQVMEVKRGKGGGTYVHPVVALALAEWLSPEFEVAVKTVAKRFQCLLQQTGSRQPHARVSG